MWPASSSWTYARLLFSSSARSFLEAPGYIDRNASVTGFFLRLPLLPDSTAVALGAAVGVAVAVVGIWVAVRLDRNGSRVTGLVILLCTSVLISPIVWDHYFTFAPLLVFVIMEVGISSTVGKLAALALACFAFRGCPTCGALRIPTSATMCATW